MCSKVTALMRRNGTRYVHLSLIFFAPYLFILFLFTKAYEITEEDHYQPRRRRGSSDSGSSFGSNRGSSSNYSTDTELEIDPVSRCPICNLPIELRNPEIEKIAVIFNQMMSHRMKM